MEKMLQRSSTFVEGKIVVQQVFLSELVNVQNTIYAWLNDQQSRKHNPKIIVLQRIAIASEYCKVYSNNSVRILYGLLIQRQRPNIVRYYIPIVYIVRSIFMAIVWGYCKVYFSDSADQYACKWKHVPTFVNGSYLPTDHNDDGCYMLAGDVQYPIYEQL